VCPAQKQVLDPFQFNFILQVPGQTVAAHIDGAYFWGATRFQYPQWLLAVMVFSGLFKEQFVDQVQVVGYLHDWTPTDVSAKTGKPSTQHPEEDWQTKTTAFGRCASRAPPVRVFLSLFYRLHLSAAFSTGTDLETLRLTKCSPSLVRAPPSMDPRLYMQQECTRHRTQAQV
jgi:hypothetical protein